MPLSSDERSVWKNERQGKLQPRGAHGIMVGRRILSVQDDFRGLFAMARGRSDEGRHTALIFVR